MKRSEARAPKPAMTYRGTTALVTGASSGIGWEFAAQLAGRGADVVLVARREDRLRDLAEELTGRHGVRATALPLDLTRPGVVADLREALVARAITIDTLVNNAGFGRRGAFMDEDPARLTSMMQLNMGALAELTREFLPDLVASGRGALVNIASVVAYQPTPNMALYGATKAFVLSLTEALAYETRHTGLRVLAVSPGSTATEFFEVAAAQQIAGARVQSPEQVVRGALRRLDRRRTPASVVSGASNALAVKLASVLPRPVALAVTGRLLS